MESAALAPMKVGESNSVGRSTTALGGTSSLILVNFRVSSIDIGIWKKAICQTPEIEFDAIALLANAVVKSVEVHFIGGHPTDSSVVSATRIVACYLAVPRAH